MPESMAESAAARKRLVFDELLRVQVELVRRKRELERTAVGIAHVVGEGGGPLVKRFHDVLPYELTGAQARTIGEINEDLAKGHPMHRLLQGDVGAGKTVVAVSAMLVAVQGGHQAALMAPTEVLAEQHHLGIKHLLWGSLFPIPTKAICSAAQEWIVRCELHCSRIEFRRPIVARFSKTWRREISTS
jgi:ATP-dependent DNA helicase RecG